MNFRIFIVIGLAVGLSGCSSEEPVGCAADVESITAYVVNLVGQRLDGLQVTDTVRRTGAALAIADQAGSLPAEGRIVPVFADEFLPDIRTGGEEVIVVASAGGHVGSGLFRFGSDGCHVQKLAGPDSLTVS